ncbi:MAG: glycosyltransferase [Burkholderiales bacterium]
MSAASPAARAQAATRAGRHAEALAAAREWIAAAPSSPVAHRCAAQASIRLGDAGGAARAFEAAEALGGGAECAFNAGNAWRAAGEPALALAAWRRALPGAAGLGTHAMALGRALAAAGDRGAAAAAWLARFEADPAAFDAVQAIVSSAAADRARAATPLPFAARGPRPAPGSFGFVVCSVDSAKFAALSDVLDARFGAIDHEILRVPDARSLAEGYSRGLERMRADAVVFCHDDIDILAPDAADRLAIHLTTHDIVGVAGSTRATGPAFSWTGHPTVHGWVTHRPPEASGFEPSFLSLAYPAVGGIEVLDGVFIACRREAAVATGFDATTFDGFHGYDIDFSFRAFLAGRSLAVACDLALVHFSKGRYDEVWQRYADRLRAKFAGRLDGPVGAAHFHIVQVPGADDVLRAQQRLAETLAVARSLAGAGGGSR